MKINHIKDWIQSSQTAFCSPKNIHGDMSENDPSFQKPNIISLSTPKIRAIKADNLQIAVSVTAGLGICYVRGTPLFNGPVASSIIEFSFNAQKEVVNTLVNNYNLNNASENTAFRNKLGTLINYFVVMISIGQTISDDTANVLDSMGDWFIVGESGGKAYCAVGYSKKIIDSVIEPNAADLFVNGQSAVIQDGSYYGSYYSFLLPNNDDIDYIVTKHHNYNNNFIIRDHAISVLPLNGELWLKTPSNNYSESKFGARYYLFEPLIANSSIITGSYITSVARSLREASRKRNGFAGSTNFFYGQKLKTTDLSTILGDRTSFHRRYSNPSITDKNGTFEKSDLETVIREAEGIKLNVAACYGSCTYICKYNCDAVCISSCGIQCSGSCLNQCSNKCGYYICDNKCSNSCSNVCRYTCSGDCLGICSGNCGTTCGTSCGTNCTGNCDMNCNTGCRQDSNSSSSCYGCWRVCRGGCDNGCDGDCRGSCQNECKNKCYGVCSAGGCSNTCTGSCSQSCAYACANTSCSANCEDKCSGQSCSFTCSLTCGQDCQILCENGCLGSCSESCSFTCFAAASNGATHLI